MTTSITQNPAFTTLLNDLQDSYDFWKSLGTCRTFGQGFYTAIDSENLDLLVSLWKLFGEGSDSLESFAWKLIK